MNPTRPPTCGRGGTGRRFIPCGAGRAAGFQLGRPRETGGIVRRGISTVEVLIVVSILLFLLAALIPGLAAAREGARRVMCMNNLRQWGRAVQAYRQDFDDYLPTEGTYLGHGIQRDGTWFNELPRYLDLPAYRDLDRIEDQIKALPDLHVWICPSKNLTTAYRSSSGKNQFHYGFNQVLDGLGTPDHPSPDAPDFPDPGAVHLQTRLWVRHPNTVLMFEIYPNSPAGTPRDVATKYQRTWSGRPAGRFHGDYANVLYVDGGVNHVTTGDLVTNHDFRHGKIVWYHPRLYWGYAPP